MFDTEHTDHLEKCVQEHVHPTRLTLQIHAWDSTMRYYFDLIDASAPLLDMKGMELANAEAALATAIRQAHHHAEAKKRAGAEPSGYIRIRDELNRTVADVPIE